MSQPMKLAEKNLNTITEKRGLPEEQLERVKIASKIVTQNLNKIWLRTKVGKPLAESMFEAAVDTLNKLESGASQAEIIASIDDLEAKAKEIEEESRRRSMVVT